MKFKLYSLLAILSVFFSCKNDIDINAPYEDIAIVYGFLDQNQSVQYIRIEKMYQNSGTLSTSEGAQIADSLYFDSLVVKLINLTTNVTYLCNRIDTIAKDSGFFSSGRNTLYAASIPKNNNGNERYRLEIYYPKKNKTFYAETNLVKDAILEERKVVLKLSPSNHSFSMKFTTGANSYLYDLTLRYTYKEMKRSDTSQYEIKYLDYVIARSKKYNAQTNYAEFIYTSVFLDYLKSKFKDDPTIFRRTLGFTFQAYGGSEEFKNMLDLSKPNLSIVEKNPLYSNIYPEGKAIGIFSSRNYSEISLPEDFNTSILIAQQVPTFIW